MAKPRNSDHDQRKGNSRKRLNSPLVVLRSRVYRAIREFFYKQDFLEVQTPVRIKTPALEDFIDAESSGSHYLRTSPELHMKRLLQRGGERIFQIGPCFRRGETGRFHHPEFTMLEWYWVQADYNDILRQTEDLLKHVLKELKGMLTFEFRGLQIDFSGSWEKISVKEAFETFAGIQPEDAIKEDSFDSLLVEKIEPKLGLSKPTFLMDYPIDCGALARSSPSNPKIAERWELYIGGLEMANAYSELTDPHEQLKRFEKSAQSRASRNQEVYQIDSDFIEALEQGLPPCAGCALGVDRLLMVLTNSHSIDKVLF